MKKYIKTILHLFSIKILKQYHHLWYMFLLYLNVIIDQKGHGYSNMICKRIPVDIIMSSARPTIDRLDNKYSNSNGKNYQCNFADELILDYERECSKVFRYVKGEV